MGCGRPTPEFRVFIVTRCAHGMRTPKQKCEQTEENNHGHRHGMQQTRSTRNTGDDGREERTGLGLFFVSSQHKISVVIFRNLQSQPATPGRRCSSRRSRAPHRWHLFRHQTKRTQNPAGCAQPTPAERRDEGKSKPRCPHAKHDQPRSTNAKVGRKQPRVRGHG